MLFGLVCAIGTCLLLTGCRRSGNGAADTGLATLGQYHVAAVAIDCTEPTDFVFSLDGRHVIYTGWLNGTDVRRVGVWVNVAVG